MTPYHQFVQEILQCLDRARRHPLGQFPPAPRPALAHDAPKALFFSPHPDDECISGGLALRLLREARMNVINVAVTQGSKKERQEARFQELRGACGYLGFGLLQTVPGGLEKINLKTRQQDPAHWNRSVEVIARLLAEHRPQVVLFPHERDWNSTHIGTHFLVIDAFARLPQDYQCYSVETEFWGAMDDPNLMVEMSANDLGDMLAALTFHVGELARNPYHLLLPAWMMDNVRRGAELVGGQGGPAPDFQLAALCRVRKRVQGNWVKTFEGGKVLPQSVNAGTLFG